MGGGGGGWEGSHPLRSLPYNKSATLRDILTVLSDVQEVLVGCFKKKFFLKKELVFRFS